MVPGRFLARSGECRLSVRKRNILRPHCQAVDSNNLGAFPFITGKRGTNRHRLGTPYRTRGLGEMMISGGKGRCPCGHLPECFCLETNDLDVTRAECLTNPEIIPAVAIPHCRTENLILRDIVKIDRDTQHRVEGNQIGADQPK